METRNPYQPTVIESSRPRARAYPFALLSLMFLALVVSAIKLGYYTYTFMPLPVVFGFIIPWALGCRFWTIVVCLVISCTGGIAGVEVALSMWGLMPTTKRLEAEANERTLTAAYIVGSFVGAWSTMLLHVGLRALFHKLPKDGNGLRWKMLRKRLE